MSKHYYAIYDHFVDPYHPSWGFSNTKSAMAFKTKRQRDAWVGARKLFDFSADVVPRAEAAEYAEDLGPRLTPDKYVVIGESHYTLRAIEIYSLHCERHNLGIDVDDLERLRGLSAVDGGQ